MAQRSTAPLVSSVPLSLTMTWGVPRSNVSRSSSRTTRTPPNEVSTTMVRHSRLKSSTIARNTEAAPVAECVRDEVERPALVDGERQHHRRPRSQRALTAAAPAHHQLFLTVQPIELLAVHRVSFAGQQPTQTPVAEAAPLLRQLAQALTQCRIVRTPGLIAPYRMIDSHQPAGASLTQPVLLDQPVHREASRRRPQPFFPSRSLSAALSSIDSANSFFSRRFSSSSDFSRRAAETSSPPYFAFHL